MTDEHSCLSFHKGDIIRLQVMDSLEKGEAHTDDIPCNSSGAHPCVCVLQVRVRVSVQKLIPVCVCSAGQAYGCVVRKKVVFLEELKKNTQDFGETIDT